MDPSMRVTFIKETHRAKVGWCTQMGRYTKEIGFVMRLMDMVCIRMKMGLLMKVIGNMTYSRERASKNGQMEGLLFIILAILRDNMNWVRKMVLENLHGQMDLFMRVISSKIILRVRESILGQMENTTRGHGFWIRSILNK